MRRAVRSLIRLVGAGLMLFGGLEIGLELLRHYAKKMDTILWHYVIGALVIGLGVYLIAASARLAEKVTDDFDE